MLYQKKPKNYITEVEVAGCIIECQWEVLLLQRPLNMKFWGTWVEPGGKLDPWESTETAMIREIFEETGITIKLWEAKYLFKKYFYFDDKNIAITFYRVTLPAKPQVVLSSKEHSDFIWITPMEASKMNLIEDFGEILKEIYKI